MGIKIVTDSASDLSTELEKEYGVIVVPLTVNIDGTSYKDREEISPEEFYEKLKNSKSIPVTSQVNPKEFIDVFKPIIENGDEVVGIFLSSTMSGTYNSAVVAKEMLNTDKISVIDSKMVTLGESSIVVKAIKMVAEGKSREEIVTELNKCIEKTKTFMIVDTLEYLKKGGRLSASEAFIGDILNLKPILTFEDGKLVPAGKVRGRKKALNWVRSWLKDNKIDLKGKTVYMLHSQAPEYFLELKQMLVDEYNADDIIEYIVGAVVGTHAGPGAVAFSFINQE